MARPPEFHIDPESFWKDPYPTLAEMRSIAPIAHVPELGAILFTRRDDIFVCEKNIEVFSSDQPGGLMTVLMGQNMMRKDGQAHQAERKQIFPSISPRTVREHWRAKFEQYTNEVLDDIETKSEVDLVTDFAMPVSAHALREITGLTCMTAAEMDASSQGMIDGCANYAGDPAIEARCHEATARIDAAIDERLPEVEAEPDFSMLSILTRAGQDMTSVRANIKLTISGGQNEPRDAIAGTTWALLSHPNQLDMVRQGKASWSQAFEEYARWVSPIGMSPRRVAQNFTYHAIDFEEDERAFFMFGAANRDPECFENPDQYDLTRDGSKAIPFGAGPHFCAGAAASKCLISEVALPKLFERIPDLRLKGETSFGGWAFRGPLNMPVAWQH